MRVLKNIETTINIDNFENKYKCSEKIDIDIILTNILRKNNIYHFNMVFNTRDKHKDLDIVDKIIKYDRVWSNDNNHILAFWDYKSEVLYY